MKKSLSAVIASVIVCMIFSACGISKKDKKETTVEETTIKEETKESKEAVAKVVEMKNTAVNDGNLVGNMVCYGRMVNNKDEYYFRNPKDQERIYSVDMAGNVKKISGDIFMKDMHMLDGVIYYANTTVGDQKDTNFTDRNLYKYSTYTGENTKLTDLGFGTGDDSWLSFESLVDNYCYFSYSNGADGIYHIARVKTDGSDLTELFTIPAGQNVGNPNVSVVDRKYVYFLSKDGLNCYDMESKQNKIAIPNFDCQNYFIYDGTIYYTEEDPYLRSCDLSGGNQRTVYDGSKLGFNVDSIQFNIYNNTLYALIKSYAQHMGSLKRMNLDGSNVADIAEDIKWFNIVNGNVFLRYWDGKSKPDTELYTYNIAANTPIGQLVNFDAAMNNAKPQVSTQKDSTLPVAKYLPYFKDSKIIMGLQTENAWMESIGHSYDGNLGLGEHFYGNIYDRGDYYEVKNVNLYTPYLYDEEPTTDMIYKASQKSNEEYLGASRLKNGKWIIYGEDDSEYSYIYYTGSIYIRKDATVYTGRVSDNYNYRQYALKDVLDKINNSDNYIEAYILEVDEKGYVKVLANQEWG